MKFIIVGTGSAAKKFIKILLEKKQQVFVYHHRDGLEIPEGCHSITSLKDLSRFDAGIIASPTASHLLYAVQFIKQKLPTLIEKPLSDSMRGVLPIMKLAQENKVTVVTGFNLRYLPIVQKIQSYIEKGKLGKVLHADLYVGQYLPEWRPWLDYRTNYSASHKKGGGVSLDLIHEVDLALHFFPNIKLYPLVSSKLGNLEIDTEDYVQFQTKKKPYIIVHMDYLNHIKTREYRIIGAKGSILCDIFGKRFEFRSKIGKQEIVTDPVHFDIQQSFASEINHFVRVIKKKNQVVSKRSLGIDALQIAVKGRKYVQR